MRIGQRVDTDYGVGTIIKCEGEIGILSKRYLVKLDKCVSIWQSDLQQVQGGIGFMDSELEKVKELVV